VLQNLSLAPSPIAHLSAQFGDRLQLICTRHKTLMLACFAYQLAHNRPMSDAVEEIDPNAYLPSDITDALVSLDCLPQTDYLNLAAMILDQLRLEVQ
jgi:hypothetical protein